MQEKKGRLGNFFIILGILIFISIFIILFLYLSKGGYFNKDETTQEEKIRLSNEFSKIIEKKNPELCKSLNEKYQDSCYIQLGLILEEYSLCEREVDENLVSLQEECFFNWAKSEQDISICDKIKNIEEDNSGNKWYCYLSISHSKNDISICEKIEDKKIQSRCYYLFSIKGNDSSVCEKVEETDITSIDNCYINVAVNAKDLSLCEKVLNKSNKDNCYILLAKEIGDAQICEKVLGIMEDSTLTLKDSCYLQFASERKDSSVCDRFKDSDVKNSCILNAQ